MSMEGDGSGIPGSTIEPSRGVVGLIQLNIDEGRYQLENPSAMLTTAALLLLLLLLLYPAAQVHVEPVRVVFSNCGLQTKYVVLRRRAFMDPGYNMWLMQRLSPAS